MKVNAAIALLPLYSSIRSIIFRKTFKVWKKFCFGTGLMRLDTISWRIKSVLIAE